MNLRALTLAAAVIVCASCGSSTAPPQAPAAPESLVATPTHGQINITWVDKTGSKGTYEVEYSLDGVAWQPLQKTAPGVTSVSHIGIEYQTKYYYRVRACTDAGCSAWVQTSTQWTGGQGPQVLSARAISGTIQAQVFGSVDHGGLRTTIHFVVTPEGGQTFLTPDFFLDPRTPGVQETQNAAQILYGLTEGTNYTFVLVAKNGAGEAQASGSFRTSVTGPPIVTLTTRPDAVVTDASNVSLGASVDPGGQNTDTWFEVATQDAPFANAQHYPSTLGTIATGFVSNVSVKLPSLPGSTSYKWRAGARNALGTTYSDSAFFKTP